ncbi:MAG: helix-turn-helix transcriptional regulator [Pseudomonadota bacterium]|uniref:helix-turn-helix transcriptional regulator n=1 Tax=Tardiphaga sp. TaxID=1926292 RepID=UPI00334E34A7
MENTNLAFSSHSDFGSDRAKAHSIEKPDSVNLTEVGGLRGARIASVISQINESFADQQFSTRVVAEKLGLSVRYVQDLLQGSGLSITDRIMELRLEKARSMLTGDRQCSLKISEVAAACGFNELSYFHRSFRRRFGASPAKFRIQSMNG